MKIFVEGFSFNIYFIDKIHQTKNRYVLETNQYYKIQADISCVCAAKNLTPLKKVKQEIEKFELPTVKISQGIIQGYESSNEILSDKNTLFIKMKFIFSRIKENSNLLQKDIWIIQNHLEKLRQSLWEIIGL